VGEVVFSCNTHFEGNPMLMTMTACDESDLPILDYSQA
jgi:hypothetical protein